MKNIKQFSKIFLALIFLTSCRSSINDLNPIINSEEPINKNNNIKKEKLEIKISCGNDDIKKYLDEGWIIRKEDSKEKICTWKSVPATKDCDMEKDKGCKLTKPDKIGVEKTYLLEK